VEVIEEWTDGSNKPLHSPEVSEFLKQKKSGKFPSFPKPPQAEKIPYQKRLKYEGDKIVVRPVKAEIETFKRQNSEAEYPVPDVGLAVKQGRALGRKLRRILQLKEDSQKHRRSGKLDLKEAVRQISRYGSISSPRIFRRDIRNSWQHSVGILVDFSGSMSHSRKLERAKAAALVLASVMEELHLPYFIRGFCAKPGQNHIADIIMKDFGEGLSINRLNKAIPPKSWDVNRDSDSIRNAGKALSAYGRGVKILFVISDGMPNHQDGMQERSFMIGNTPIMDTRNAVDEMQKLGIQVVGIAIEQEAKGCMNQIYPTSFYVKDLGDLSRQLLRIYADKIKPLLG
jgi:nitric oxide reductase activation protein